MEARGAAALAALADRAEGWAADAKEAAENQGLVAGGGGAARRPAGGGGGGAPPRAHAHGQQAARHVKQLGRELLLEVRARVSELAAELGAGPEGNRRPPPRDGRARRSDECVGVAQASMANQIEMHAVATEQRRRRRRRRRCRRTARSS